MGANCKYVRGGVGGGRGVTAAKANMGNIVISPYLRRLASSDGSGLLLLRHNHSRGGSGGATLGSSLRYGGSGGGSGRYLGGSLRRGGGLVGLILGLRGLFAGGGGRILRSRGGAAGGLGDQARRRRGRSGSG